MTDIRRDIERILNSTTIDGGELSHIADVLRTEKLFDLADKFTTQLVLKHPEDDALLMRAWYLADIAGRYKEASDILRTIGTSNDVMFALLCASVRLHITNDADAADGILEDFAKNHQEAVSDMALEAARMFITCQFTDMAEKWILHYNGEKDNDYLMVYGEILIAREEFDKAADIYRKITQTDGTCCETWTRLSDVLINAKDYKSAMEAAENALRIDKNCNKALENIHICTLCMNRHNNKITNNQ